MCSDVQIFIFTVFLSEHGSRRQMTAWPLREEGRKEGLSEKPLTVLAAMLPLLADRAAAPLPE